MSWLSVLMTPLSVVFRLTISSLSYLLSSLLFIASPVIYLGQVVLYLTLLPLRILIRLEAFIYFMTGAMLIGATVGIILHLTGSTISRALRIEGSDDNPRRHTRLPGGRRIHLSASWKQEDPKDFSATWKQGDPKDVPWSTILEEEESSHESE